MQTGKLISMVGAIAITGTGLLGIRAAEAKNRESPVTIYGQRSDDSPPSRRVSYADLNLATLSGEKMLNKRVGSAVRGVCYEAVPDSDLRTEMKCHSFAWSGARPQIQRAVQRAREIALNGHSSIMPVTISLAFSK